jgi:hypothetical protein
MLLNFPFFKCSLSEEMVSIIGPCTRANWIPSKHMMINIVYIVIYQRFINIYQNKGVELHDCFLVEVSLPLTGISSVVFRSPGYKLKMYSQGNMKLSSIKNYNREVNINNIYSAEVMTPLIHHKKN